jgi:hypothetical protein
MKAGNLKMNEEFAMTKESLSYEIRNLFVKLQEDYLSLSAIYGPFMGKIQTDEEMKTF